MRAAAGVASAAPGTIARLKRRGDICPIPSSWRPKVADNGEIRVNLWNAAPLISEMARGRQGHRVAAKLGGPRPAQASMVPSVTTTASPPIAADASLPPAIVSATPIRLGRPIS